jgi:hypothetical protein
VKTLSPGSTRSKTIGPYASDNSFPALPLPQLALGAAGAELAIDPVLVRPDTGTGPNQVHFAMMAKNFFGTDLKHMRFNIDIILSLRWKDPRVVKLIPEGQDKLTIAWSQALARVWMPGIVVANRDIEKYEVISASVTLFRSGEVLRVERAHARCMKKFMLEEYPFDKQDLYVDIVSSKYMSDEVVLVPNKSASGVDEHIWGLYELEGWHTEAILKSEGDLKKSRGFLVLSLRRTLGKYIDDHLVPSFIVLTISWAVFYFPFGTNPFITPRLALSILALLTFTNLMVKSAKELPGAAPFNFNDLFNQQIQVMMFATIIINIGSEVCFHQLGMEQLARGLNNEAKILIPVNSLISIVIILAAGRYNWISLYEAVHLAKAFMLLFFLCYAAYVGYALVQASSKSGAGVFAVTTAAGAIAVTTTAATADDADCDAGDADCDCGM